MFRRRPLRRRPLIRPRPHAFIGDGPRQALFRANRLMDSGDFKAAGEIFERLAEGAIARGMYQRAPFLFLQAGKAYVQANQTDRGIALAQRGLKLLADAQRWPALNTFGTAAVNELQKKGLTDAAGRIQQWLEATIPDTEDTTLPAASKRPSIPGKCPYCGATLRPNEIEWLDEQTAECQYCGSAIQEDE